MASKPKKEVLCDYCHSSDEAKNMFSGQKVFAMGRKIVGLLEIVTHSNHPANAAVRVCFHCASNLLSVTQVIEKSKNMVARIALGLKNEELDFKSSDEERPVSKPNRNTTIRQRSKSIAAVPETPLFTGSTTAKGFHKKLDGSAKSRLLEDSIKMTPAKEVSPKKKAFKQLFGTGDDDAAELTSESEEGETEEGATKTITFETNNFKCNYCEYVSKYPKQFKEHLHTEHGQQRPRIYSCPRCPKSFGVLKTMKDHLLLVHSLVIESGPKATKSKQNKSEGQQTVDANDPKEPMIQEEPKAQNRKPKEVKPKAKKPEEVMEIKSKDSPKKAKSLGEQAVSKAKNDKDNNERDLATFKALNDTSIKKKMFDKLIDPEYTFAINGSSASTPRAESSDFQCDICDCELTTAKQMQDHMKTAHGIDKPKIFKCNVCEKSLTTKQSLNKHMNLHGEGAELANSTKRKILQAEEEIVEIESSVEWNKMADNDEMPKEEKIEREQYQVDGAMPAPQSPLKKFKKSKSGLLDTSVATTNGESPSKAEKRTKQNKSGYLSSDQWMEEINHNVKPHKKARLESVTDSTADESTSSLSCNQCAKPFHSVQRLHEHVHKKHTSSLKCPNCSNIFSSHLDYVGHFSECGAVDALPCGVANCKKSFSDANYLSSHLRKRHQYA
ncbi:zinc finger protein CG2199 [Drosophila gunungcola]|uniref:zinc finger protein CG2199 n=1 Tax=Drosophila gunungcola TaxID=103775 RepID=UPI0022E3BDC3|nr:zinc finger protein CG2199 [Drosophila gunungcola]